MKNKEQNQDNLPHPEEVIQLYLNDNTELVENSGRAAANTDVAEIREYTRDRSDQAKVALGHKPVAVSEHGTIGMVVEGKYQDRIKHIDTAKAGLRGLRKILGSHAYDDSRVSAFEAVGTARGHQDYAKERLQFELDVVRQKIDDLDSTQKKVYNRLMGRHPELPKFIRQQKPEDYSWVEWMTGRGSGDSETSGGATDAQLLNILQWQVDLIEKFNAEHDGGKTVEELRQQSIHAYEKAVFDGRLPKKILDQLHKAELMPKPIIVEDFMILATHGASGLKYEDGTISIYDKNQNKTLYHEFAHAYIGSYAIEDRAWRWLDEAVTETLANIALDNPDRHIYHSEDQKSYKEERRLLAAIIEASEGSLTLEDVIEGYMGDEHEQLDIQIKIHQALKSVLPEDVTIDAVMYEIQQKGSKNGSTNIDIRSQEALEVGKIAEKLEQETAAKKYQMDEAPPILRQAA